MKRPLAAVPAIAALPFAPAALTAAPAHANTPAVTVSNPCYRDTAVLRRLRRR
jgi:hypothetical protein